MKTLKDILVIDESTAKKRENSFVDEVLPPGSYTAKIIGFTEEDTYQYITVEINKKRYNMFYNYYIPNTTDLDANLISWIKALATIPVLDNTSLLEIANSAIGSSYKIVIYNYISKKGQYAGKPRHSIDFRELPVLETVTIEEEIIEDLPF
jgi:hypothetical protein